MPHVWTKRNTAAEWTPEPLAGPLPLGGEAAPARVVPAGEAGFVLLVRRGATVRLNGVPVALGIARLADRDEIVAGGERVFFSTEKTAEVVAFPGLETGPCICARCATEIAIGAPAICCPGCGTWSHESAELPCFTYEKAATCARCDQENKVDAEFRFHPAAL